MESESCYACKQPLKEGEPHKIQDCAEALHRAILLAERRESKLISLLKKAQARLRNQGDVPELTHKINLIIHDEIELELGGGLLLSGRPTSS